jgi:hypothetical protein
MEPEIRRTGFFNGQFLREGEFINEQTYHLHMRRRWAYALFDQSGVVQSSATDLTVVPESGTRIRVRAGLAIGRVDDDREAKEIVLREDEIIDLTAPSLGDSIGAGETARVTVHYEEEPVANPPSVGDVPGDTRILEHARVTVHNSDPPATAPNGEPYIRLANVIFDTMAVDDVPPARQFARINGLLLGAAPGPSLTGITLTSPSSSVAVGATVPITATGQFSSGPDQTLNPATLTWTSSDSVTATIDPSGQVTGLAPGSASITAQFGAITSAPFAVTVVPVAVTVTIDAVMDNLFGAAGGTARVRGTNLHEGAITPGNPATGTTVRLIDSTDPANFVPASVDVGNPIAGSPQRIDVLVPPRTAFPTPPTPLVTFINIEVQFGGGSDVAVDAFRYSA